MSDTPELAAQPAESIAVPPAPLRTQIIPVRVTPEEHVALKTRARAAGVGTSTYLRLRSLEGLGRATRSQEHQ